MIDTSRSEVKSEKFGESFSSYPMGYEHDPLTPPRSEHVASPSSEAMEVTPQASPSGGDHLRNLEMSVERRLSSSSPKVEDDLDLNEDFNTPQLNSHGKVKTSKCKQCGFISSTKADYWRHYKTHISPDKLQECSICPFVTEYKHHITYHMLLHAGEKPYKCDKCDYACVNKSMLNSHAKSHSNIYRFNCSECVYASKYLHSLKLHCRRYQHQPSVVLDEYGRPDPKMIVDVYGNRRGPKSSRSFNEKKDTTPKTPQFAGISPNQFLETLQRALLERQAVMAATAPQLQEVPLNKIQETNLLMAAMMQRQMALMPQVPVEEPGVLDLSVSGSNRRKSTPVRRPPSLDSEGDDVTTMFSNVEVVESNNNEEDSTMCPHCQIDFMDGMLYKLHMEYHGPNHPFECNGCDFIGGDKVAFFMHISRTPHKFN